jgi:PDDEXK-like domain of unknown function (DUF3799)
MMRISAPGIYREMATADYHADPAPTPSLTQSIAKILIERSPAHARLAHPRLAPPATEEDPVEPYSEAKAIGSAAHLFMTGRGKDVVEGAFDDWRTKEAKSLRDAAIANGQTPILSKHLARANEMVRAAAAQLMVAKHENAFVLGHGEVVLCWREAGDVWLRTMIDWLIDTRHAYDLKTTSMSVAPHVAVERPSTEGWDIQAAMFERGLDALDPDGAGRREFVFINQENRPPFALTPVRISEADLTMGRKKLQHAVEIWRRCMETDTWPLYPSETITSRPRPHTEARWLDRELEHEEQRKGVPSDILTAG